MPQSPYQYTLEHPDFTANRDMVRLAQVEQAYITLTRDAHRPEAWQDADTYNALRGSLQGEIKYLKEQLFHAMADKIRRAKG